MRRNRCCGGERRDPGGGGGGRGGARERARSWLPSPLTAPPLLPPPPSPPFVPPTLPLRIPPCDRKASSGVLAGRARRQQLGGVCALKGGGGGAEEKVSGGIGEASCGTNGSCRCDGRTQPACTCVCVCGMKEQTTRRTVHRDAIPNPSAAHRPPETGSTTGCRCRGWVCRRPPPRGGMSRLWRRVVKRRRGCVCVCVCANECVAKEADHRRRRGRHAGTAGRSSASPPRSPGCHVR